MEIDTGQFRAIVAENGRLRLDVAALIRVTAGALDALEASGGRLVPALTVVAVSGRGRHAAPRRGHLRAVSGRQP